MAKKKDDDKLNERDRSYSGCYGLPVSYEEMIGFVRTNIALNEQSEARGQDRFAMCVWGHPGIGKTDIIKQLANQPCVWNGKTYPGYDVKDVPLAQFEEMGDLHGIPMDCVRMRNNGNTQWVPQKDETIRAYRDNGWSIDTSVQPRTMMAPPPWVPMKEGPSILLLDDWNRASIRILKGTMQLLQNYGMVSWSLPKGCNIILTGNPDEQDYLVTTIDEAILTRIKHVTLREDAKEWAVWASAQNLDGRGISWVLYQPEMMLGRKLTNPRTLAEFFRFMPQITNLDSEGERKKFLLHGLSLLDEETVNNLLIFCTRDMEIVIEPEDILEGKKEVAARVKDLLERSEPRMDILGVTCERLFAHMCREETKQTKERMKHFHRFVNMTEMPEDLRHSVCRRLARRPSSDAKDGIGKNQRWLLGSDKLRELVLEMLH